MSHQTIWEVFDNLGVASQAHYRARQEAVNKMLGNLKAVVTANPGSYWRIEEWTQDDTCRSTVRVGPGANSTILADYSLQKRTLADVLE